MSSPAETKKIVKKSKAAAPEVAAPAPAVAATPAPAKKAAKAVPAKTEVTVPVVPAAAAPAAEAAPSAAPTTLEIVERIRDLRTRFSAELKTIIADTLAAAKSSAREVKDARRRKRVKKDVADMTPEEKAIAQAKRAANKAAKASATNSAEGSRASSPPKMKGE
jgi:hypothetical protein